MSFIQWNMRGLQANREELSLLLSQYDPTAVCIQVWSMVSKIAGKSPATNIKHLNLNNTEITEIPDIANSLGQTFSNNSSSNNYSTKFQGFRNQAENQHLKFKSNNLETYNNPFSFDELQDAISKSHDSAVGPDDIHYQILKHLPPNAVNTLLQALNNIWFAGNFPRSWRTSTVIPIPKPAKDASDPNNYRPIALTSCLCKVMERIVNNRLVWFLQRNKLITPLQCGFRKQRSTTDHLVRLESFIREAFIQRQHAVAVFRPGKGVRLYMEVRHHERPLRGRSAW